MLSESGPETRRAPEVKGGHHQTAVVSKHLYLRAGTKESALLSGEGDRKGSNDPKEPQQRPKKSMNQILSKMADKLELKKIATMGLAGGHGSTKSDRSPSLLSGERKASVLSHRLTPAEHATAPEGAPAPPPFPLLKTARECSE